MNSKSANFIALVALLLLATVASLSTFGRNWWCSSGEWVLWSFSVNSHHNSQHLIDWYTPSHFSHGLLFALLARLIFKLRGVDGATKFLPALFSKPLLRSYLGDRREQSHYY